MIRVYDVVFVSAQAYRNNVAHNSTDFMPCLEVSNLFGPQYTETNPETTLAPYHLV